MEYQEPPSVTICLGLSELEVSGICRRHGCDLVLQDPASNSQDGVYEDFGVIRLDGFFQCPEGSLNEDSDEYCWETWTPVVEAMKREGDNAQPSGTVEDDPLATSQGRV